MSITAPQAAPDTSGAGTVIGAAGGALAVVTGVGGAVSIAGGVLSAIGNFFSGLVKGPTQHLGWDAANTKAIQVAAAMETLVKTVAPGKLDAIGEAYRVSMIAWISSIRGARWGVGFPENTDNILTSLRTFPQGGDLRSKVYITTWLWSMWTLRNSDMNNPDEWVNIAVNDMNKVLLPAIKQVAGVSVPNFVIQGAAGSTGVGTVGGSTVTSGTNAGGGLVTAGITNPFAALGVTDGVIIAIIIGLLIWFGVKK